MEQNTTQEVKKSWFVNKKTAVTNWLKKLFPPKEQKDENPISDTTQETKKEREIRLANEKFNKLIDEFKEQTSLNVDGDKLTNAINGFQLYETIILEADGYNDGIVGVKNKNIIDVATARASFIFEHTNSILEGREIGLEKEKNIRKEKIERLNKEIEEEKKFNEEISDLFKRENRYFSKHIAWFYLIIGIFMMIADFPISLGISKYFIDTPIDSSDEFFDKILQLDSVLFALGITFLSVYFKIMYDDYINVGILSRKRKNDTNIKEFIKFGVSTVRFIIKLGILIFFIYFLYNIGSARNALNELPIKSARPDIVSNIEVFNFKLISFIGTTILLPLFSGIALSLSLGIFSNIKNRIESNLILDELYKKVEDTQEKIIELNTICSTVSKFKEDWQREQNDKLKKLIKQFENAYLQGYKKGHRMKFGYDIYENANSLYIDDLNS